MSGITGVRSLRAVLTVGGAIVVATGIFGLATGAGGIPGDNVASASVESELRFLYVFWIAYGLALIRVAPRAVTETWAVRALALILFVAGVGRAVAWLDVGRPDGLFIALMAVELVVPPLLVVWQARLAAASSPRTAPT
jgi:hypothetical protein